MSSPILIMSGYWWLLSSLLGRKKEKLQKEKNRITTCISGDLGSCCVRLCMCVHVSECLSAWLSFHHEAYGEYT